MRTSAATGATVPGMRQLLPEPAEDVDCYDAYRPADPHGAWLRLNMVATVDGAATDPHGRSGSLGGEGDAEVFRTLRALADGILVGAGTVRVEGYGPHRVRADLAARRRADGRHAPAAFVVASRSLDLDLAAPLFTEAVTPTVVLTCGAAPAARRRAAGERAHVVVAGDDAIDLAAGIEKLRAEYGLAHLLCEGGPSLNEELFAADVVDELCLTVAPQLVGGPGPRIIRDLAHPRAATLTALFEHEGELYTRYRVR